MEMRLICSFVLITNFMLLHLFHFCFFKPLNLNFLMKFYLMYFRLRLKESNDMSNPIAFNNYLNIFCNFNVDVDRNVRFFMSNSADQELLTIFLYVHRCITLNRNGSTLEHGDSVMLLILMTCPTNYFTCYNLQMKGLVLVIILAKNILLMYL